MQIPVMMHCWLLKGEGWAYHPSLESEKQLRTGGIVKEQLAESTRQTIWKSAKASVFHQDLGGGKVLLGIQEADKDCPDPKANERKPIKMWVAVLPGKPKTDTIRKEFLKKLKGCSTEKTGVDANLFFTINENEIETRSRKGWGMLMVSLLCLIVAGAVALQAGGLNWPRDHGKPNPGPIIIGAGENDITAITKAMKEGFDLNVQPQGGLEGIAIVNEFFQRFSQAYWLEDIKDHQSRTDVLASPHPDAQLFRLLPQKPLCSERPANSFRKQDVLNGLREIVKTLYKDDKSVQQSLHLLSAHELLAKIKSREWVDRVYADFDAQFYATPSLYMRRKENPFYFPWDDKRVKPCPDELKNWQAFLQQQWPQRNVRVTPELMPEMQQMVQQMSKYLRQWGVQGFAANDVQSRPEVVVRCFVGFLTLPLDWKNEYSEIVPPVLFMEKFPAKPIPERLFQGPVPEEAELKKMLERHFDIKRDNLKQVIDEIAKKFQYDPEKLKGDYEYQLRTSNELQQFVADVRKANPPKATPYPLPITNEDDPAPPAGIKSITITITKAIDIPKNQIEYEEIPDRSATNERLNGFVERFKSENKSRNDGTAGGDD